MGYPSPTRQRFLPALMTSAETCRRLPPHIRPPIPGAQEEQVLNPSFTHAPDCPRDGWLTKVEMAALFSVEPGQFDRRWRRYAYEDMMHDPDTGKPYTEDEGGVKRV